MINCFVYNWFDQFDRKKRIFLDWIETKIDFVNLLWKKYSGNLSPFYKDRERKQKFIFVNGNKSFRNLEKFIVQWINHADFTKIIRRDVWRWSDQYKLLSKLTILKIYLNSVMQTRISTSNLSISLSFRLPVKRTNESNRLVELFFYFSFYCFWQNN